MAELFKALEGRVVRPHVEELEPADSAALNQDSDTRRATLNRLLFAGSTRDYEATVESYGDLSSLHTRDYLYGLVKGREHVVSLGKGVRLLVSLQSISEADDKGMRTVMITLNGQSRQLMVRDDAVESTAVAAEKADASNHGHVAAPFAGAVTAKVAVGERVEAGATVATIEAMKMEAGITSTVAGTVSRLAIGGTAQVQGGDLLLVVDPAQLN